MRFDKSHTMRYGHKSCRAQKGWGQCQPCLSSSKSV